MTDPFLPTIAFTRQEEGGYTKLRSDGGNWTLGIVGRGLLVGSNMGVSAPALLAWVGPKNAGRITPLTMRSLSEGTYQAIARANYWRAMGCPALPGSLALSVFDMGWNAGGATSVALLQGLVGAEQDGDCGPYTVAKLAAFKSNVTELLRDLCVAQQKHYRLLANFGEFGSGWIARTERRLEAALKIPT